MALGGRPAGHPVLFHKIRNFRPSQLLFHHRQGRDHLVVGLRHIPRPGGFGDIRILQLRGVFVDVRELQTRPLQRLRHQGAYHHLGR